MGAGLSEMYWPERAVGIKTCGPDRVSVYNMRDLLNALQFSI